MHAFCPFCHMQVGSVWEREQKHKCFSFLCVMRGTLRWQEVSVCDVWSETVSMTISERKQMNGGCGCIYKGKRQRQKFIHFHTIFNETD